MQNLAVALRQVKITAGESLLREINDRAASVSEIS